MEWIQANWGTILIVVASVISISSVIVKLTPNETDNKILEVIIKIFEKLGLNTTPVNSNKEEPK